MRRSTIKLALGLAILRATASSAQYGQYDTGGDPPSRVGRLSDIAGSVSLYPVGAREWTGASLNYPLTSGDGVWVDTDGRAEIHLGASAIRIGAGTSLTFGEVSDSVTQVRVDQGTVEIYVHDLRDDEVYEVDTPSGVVSFTDAGRYRIDVTPDGRRTTVTVRRGSAAFDLEDGSYPVSSGRSATLINGTRRPSIGSAVDVDSWEEWANMRDRRDDAPLASRYVTRDMVGYEDLDQYGDWQSNSVYGNVWYPRGVQSGWAPYRYGHWESIGLWGWTWIDDAPWGFAPFHYGRWASVSGRWCWIPGTVRSRPVYAPALVAFIGGAGWSVSASFGGRPAVGWVPLGPQEPFIPAYRASSGYVQRVNVTNVRVNVNVTQINVNNIRYVNRDVPGGVTAVSRDDFTGSRPIGRTAVAVRPTDAARARPSAVPIAGDERIAPLPRGESPRNADRGRGNGARAATPPPAVATPTPPPRWRGRGDSRRPPPPAAPPVQPPGTPPVQPPPPDRGRGGGNDRQPPPPTAPPVRPPVTPPATQPPPPPPPPDRGRGRGNDRQPPPPTAPPVRPPVTPPATQPPPPPPPDRGRGRGNDRQPPPPAAPRVRPPAPPPTTQPPPPTKPPPPPPDRGRGRGRPTEPPATPPAAPPAKPAPPPPPPPPTGRGRQSRPPDTSRKPPPGRRGGGGAIQLPAFTALT